MQFLTFQESYLRRDMIRGGLIQFYKAIINGIGHIEWKNK